jgi:hypothetical protein
MKTKNLLLLSLLAIPLAGCMEPETISEEEQSLLDPAEIAFLDPSAEISPEMAADPGESCPKEKLAFRVEGGDLTAEAAADRGEISPVQSGLCGTDAYFHPHNGMRGGWIEGWRLCWRGGYTWQICTGGYAPVRYWNPWACGGTVHNYYPQGWHGEVYTAAGCC